ncbi:lipoprotein signal peptidase [mine drainage metagenome]|uniref:Lipoprotein signal peptidase n=1 Tax=mine drainage metagenome TaxID=410659 RepID=A0A1J5SHL9_9ZZZZ
MSRFAPRRLRLGLPAALAVVAADQISKAAILSLMRPAGVTATPFQTYAHVKAGPILDLVLSWNSGVSFGLGNTHGTWNVLAFSALAAAISAMLLGWMMTTPGRLVRLALGLVLGGALGNVADRLHYGAVVDFLYVHIGAFDWWPAFNLADSAICVGAALLMYDSLFASRVSHKE